MVQCCMEVCECALSFVVDDDESRKSKEVKSDDGRTSWLKKDGELLRVGYARSYAMRCKCKMQNAYANASFVMRKRRSKLQYLCRVCAFWSLLEPFGAFWRW